MQSMPFRSAKELVSSIRRRKIGCLELLDLYLSRIDRYNPKINAVISMNIEEARKRARLADKALAKGKIWGPLHGIPMTIKESYNVVGMPTTWGVPAHRNNYPKKNALAVDRFLKAGAILVPRSPQIFCLLAASLQFGYLCCHCPHLPPNTLITSLPFSGKL